VVEVLNGRFDRVSELCEYDQLRVSLGFQLLCDQLSQSRFDSSFVSARQQ
jgi:hypothetical protein